MDANHAPLISIGIPTYNRVTSLARSIASARAQTHENVDIVICDNASTDETESLCRRIASEDPRVRYVRHPRNIGPEENFAATLRLARGEFFMWVADDDWIDPDYVRACYDVLRGDPETSIVVGESHYYEADVFHHVEPILNLTTDLASLRVLFYLWKVDRNGPFYGLMRRREIAAVALERSNGRLHHGQLAGDWFVIAAMAFRGRIRTRRGVAIHRGMAGESAQIQRLIRRFALPPFVSRHPWGYVAMRAIANIGWESSTYASMTSRHVLGVLAASVILNRRRWRGRSDRLEQRVAAYIAMARR